MVQQMPRVSDEHKEDQKVKIMEAAIRCFRTKGIAETSMRDIFSGSGLSAGAVYNYFPSKIELIEHMARETQESWRASFLQLQKNGKDTPKEKLQLLIGTMIDGLADKTIVRDVACDIGIWAYSIHNKRLKAVCETVFQEIVWGFDCILSDTDVTTKRPTKPMLSSVGVSLLAHLQGLGFQAVMGVPINLEREKMFLNLIIERSDKGE